MFLISLSCLFVYFLLVFSIPKIAKKVAKKNILDDNIYLFVNELNDSNVNLSIDYNCDGIIIEPNVDDEYVLGKVEKLDIDLFLFIDDESFDFLSVDSRVDGFYIVFDTTVDKIKEIKDKTKKDVIFFSRDCELDIDFLQIVDFFVISDVTLTKNIPQKYLTKLLISYDGDDLSNLYNKWLRDLYNVKRKLGCLLCI